MRHAIVLASLLSLLVPACGGDDDSAGHPDAGDPDSALPPPECTDPDVGVICTIAGNGNPAYSGDEGPALDAEFSLPQDTLAVPDGSLFILDWNNHRLRRLTTDGIIHHVAGRGELGGTLDDPANDDFNHPTNVIFDKDGVNLLIAAWHNSKVRNVDVESGEVTENCGDGRRAYFGDEGEAGIASFDLPAALAWSPDGDLIIMDQANQVIRRVDAEGMVHRLAGNCIIDAPPPGGPGPCEVPTQCPGGSGKFTCGDVAATCGSPCNPGYVGGTVEAMRMSQPFGQSASPAGRIVYDGDGNLLFADTGNSLIRKIDGDGNVTIVAGLEPVEGVPQSGYSGDEGPATDAKLNGPVDLAIGGDGTIYVTDVLNHCVRSIDGDGDIHTFAGVCGTKGHDGDGGPADEAHLKIPYGVEWSDGVLYIADTGNYVIRAIRTE